MNKKQLIALIESMIASVVATANKDEDGGESLTEDEARVLLGSLVLRKQARRLVAEACHAEPEDVVWVDVAPKTRSKADAD